jgi:hypothetical protein
MSTYAGIVNSQDVFAAPNAPISVLGGGGGSVPANLTVSTLSAFGLLNISSINGAPYVGAGSIPANLTVSSLSTLALNSISSINGVAYTGAGNVPSNLTVSSISSLALNSVSSINGVAYTGAGNVPANLVVSSLTAASSTITATLNVSSINGTINPDDIPYLFLQNSGLTDRAISSINSNGGGILAASMTNCGARLTGNFSTQRGHQYLAQGFARITPVSGVSGWPAGTPNAFVAVYGGGGAVPSWVNGQLWSYPQLSTIAGLSPGGGAPVDIQWSAPGGFSIYNPDTGTTPTTSTINYKLYCSGDWPIPINVEVSTIVSQLSTLGFADTANVSFVDLGNFNSTPPV